MSQKLTQKSIGITPTLCGDPGSDAFKSEIEQNLQAIERAFDDLRNGAFLPRYVLAQTAQDVAWYRTQGYVLRDGSENSDTTLGYSGVNAMGRVLITNSTPGTLNNVVPTSFLKSQIAGALANHSFTGAEVAGLIDDHPDDDIAAAIADHSKAGGVQEVTGTDYTPLTEPEAHAGSTTDVPHAGSGSLSKSHVASGGLSTISTNSVGLPISINITPMERLPRPGET